MKNIRYILLDMVEGIEAKAIANIQMNVSSPKDIS